MKEPATIYRQAKEGDPVIRHDYVSGTKLSGLTQRELRDLLVKRAKEIQENDRLVIENDTLVRLVAVINAIAARTHGEAYFQCPLTV